MIVDSAFGCTVPGCYKPRPCALCLRLCSGNTLRAAAVKLPVCATCHTDVTAGPGDGEGRDCCCPVRRLLRRACRVMGLKIWRPWLLVCVCRLCPQRGLLYCTMVGGFVSRWQGAWLLGGILLSARPRSAAGNRCFRPRVGLARLLCCVSVACFHSDRICCML